MERHRLLRIGTALLLTFTLAAAPAVAGSSMREQFLVFLPGINYNGSLNYGSYETQDGDFVVVTALVNTYTGKFYFKASGHVVNDSGYSQFFSDENFFSQDLTDNEFYPSDVYICSSCYTVGKPYHYISKVSYTGFAVDPDEM
jgi:hypothetical protein